MAYFKNFPKVPYRFASTGKPEFVEFQNITAISQIFSEAIDDESLYTLYTVKDGTRPDLLSYQLYGTPEYYWTFYMINDHVRHSGWALSAEELEAKINEDLPGECLVFLPQNTVDLGNETNYLQHAMIEQFSVGDRIYGQISGASGTVYARNVNLGQMFVRLDAGSKNFIANEGVVDTQVGQPNSFLTARIVHSPASLAIHHFEDGDGDHVDVDYALDFRGRGSELVPANVAGLPANAGPGPDGNYVGGVVGDLVNPDPYSSMSPYRAITFKEYYDNFNDHLSRIRIIKPGSIASVARLFHNSIGTGG